MTDVSEGKTSFEVLVHVSYSHRHNVVALCVVRNKRTFSVGTQIAERSEISMQQGGGVEKRFRGAAVAKGFEEFLKQRIPVGDA